jgi:A/G-specific adenine glycosylase
MGTRIGPRLLRWYDRHGRKDLPWKRAGDPYHVWVSEVMLQQTQVATVIPYFMRFIARFPSIKKLASANIDDVLHLWTGLGYYARARNLHKAAQQLVAQHGGKIPNDFEAITDLPGIGRSTAGAILALSFGARHAILDGNVKRVLARYHAVDAPLGTPMADKMLWAFAEHHTPRKRVADYTQAIMDLGATLCRRGQPECARCPLRSGCAAYAGGVPAEYPRSAVRKQVPTKSVRMLLIQDKRGRVLLKRRPPAGIWGGLWGLPECRARDVTSWCQRELGFAVECQPAWPIVRHSFSHFHLDIEPIPARLIDGGASVMEDGDTVWYNCARPDARGLAAPVKRLLDRLRTS